jgi:hypothetical protein
MSRMSWAMAIVVPAVLTGCKASHSDTSDGAAAPAPADVGAPIEVQQPLTGAVQAPQDEAASAVGSVRAQSPAAPPLSSSLAELERAPLPEIEGEPTIAVFVERVSGGLMPDIEHATSRLRAGLRACYLRSHGDDPPDASRLALRIVVSTSGSVKSVRPDSISEIDPTAVDCMVRRAQAATFPAPVGEPAEIVLSIAFLPPRLPYR